MSLFSNTNEYCDICGSELDPEDVSIHLCKFCQQSEFEDWQNSK